MSLVSSAIKSIIDGVSQQPDALRLISQGKDQINGLSSEVDGLRKRPPTDFLAELEDADDWADAYKFVIERDEGRKFICLLRSDPDIIPLANSFTNETVRIYDLDGNRMPLDYKDSPQGVVRAAFDENGVLIGGNPTNAINAFDTYMSTEDLVELPATGVPTNNHDRFRHQTIGDYTFITNRERTPVLFDTFPDYSGVPINVGDVSAIMNIKQSFLGQLYGLTVDDGTTSLGINYITSDTDQTDTSTIATEIANGFQAHALYPNLEYTVEAYSNLIFVRRKTNAASGATALGEHEQLRIDVRGPAGRAGAVGIKNSVSKFSDLPERAPRGFRVKVSGLDNTEDNDYYVEFEPDAQSFISTTELSTGTWKETSKPGIANFFANESMPMALVYNAPDDNFSAIVLDWAGRDVGDEDSIPAPTFVGSFLQQQSGFQTGVPIMDLVFYQSRLGLVTQENIVLSRTAEYFNFWGHTATEVLDTDPIDVSASHSKIVNLHSAVTYNKSLVLFSEKAQFRLQHGTTLTPTSVSLLPTTEFENPNRVKPVQSGTTVLYPTERGRWTGMNEMFLSPEGESDVVADISNQVPRYIDGVARFLDSSPKETMVTLVTDQSDDLYVYKYFYSGNEKLQSSWSKWRFHFKALSAMFVNESLYLIGAEDGRLKLYQMSLERELFEDSLPYQIHLDAKESVTGVFDGTYTEWTLNLNTNSGEVTGVNMTPGSPELGYEFDLVEATGDHTVRVLGDFSGVPHVFGLRYVFRYDFSELFVRDTEGTPISTGRLQLRRGALTHGPSGYFKVIVANSFGDPIEVEYSGRVVDDPFPDEVSIRDGSFDFPMIGRSDLASLSVESNSHLPTSIIELEWEGFYHRRNRRV